MSSNTSILDSTTLPSAEPALSPQEAALQSLCKQILKARLFRGFYEERRYVEEVQGYRDIISLHKCEKDLHKLIKDIRNKLLMFYQIQNPNIWIGATCNPVPGSTLNIAALDTCIWSVMEDLAFGEYWFSIKTLKFRENEVIIRLKVVRPVEPEEISEKWSNTINSPLRSEKSVTSLKQKSNNEVTSITQPSVAKIGVNLKDFHELFVQWWFNIKQTIYDFMSNDISKENLKGVMRFMGLLLVSLLSASLMAIKFLGQFTIRLIFEITRLTHVLTPIILKIIDVLNKIVGGFYILLAMMWKDTIGRPTQPKYPAIEYNRPMYKSIEYEIKSRKSFNTPPAATMRGIPQEN